MRGQNALDKYETLPEDNVLMGETKTGNILLEINCQV